MPVDFAASRASVPQTDPSRIVAAISESGRQVGAYRLSGAQALAAGIANGLGSVAEGIRRSRDPREAASRAEAEASLEDASQREAADAMREGAQTMTRQEAAGLPPEKSDEFVASAVDRELGGTLPWASMTDAQKDAVRAEFRAIAGQQVLVRQGADDDALRLGKYGDPQYVGVPQATAAKQGTEAFAKRLHELAVAHPLFAGPVQQRAQTQSVAQRLESLGDAGAAEFVRSVGADEATLTAAGSFSEQYRNPTPTLWTMPDGSVRHMPLRDVVAEGLLNDPAFVAKNKGGDSLSAPRIGVVTSGGRQTFKSSVDGDVVEQFAKDSPERRLAEKKVGQSIDALNAELVGWRAAETVTDRILSKPTLAADAPDSARRAVAMRNTLAARVQSGELTRDQIAAAIAARNGLASVNPADFAASPLMTNPDAMRTLDEALAAMTADPETAKLVVSGAVADSALDRELADEAQRSMVQGKFPGRGGALAWTDAAGLSQDALLRLSDSYRKADERAPEFAYYRRMVGATPGLEPADAERFVRATYGRFALEMQSFTSAFVAPDGRPFHALDAAEQAAVKKGRADAMLERVSEHLRAVASAAPRLAAEAGRVDLQVDRAAASRAASRLAEGDRARAAIAMADGRTLLVENGRPTGIKDKDGKAVSLAGVAGDREADEAWRTAHRMSSETADPSAWQKALAAGPDAVRDPALRDLFVSGVEMRDLAALLSRDAREGDGAIVRARLATWMRERQMTATALRSRLAQEWSTGAHPAVGAVAGYVEMLLSPHRTTVEQLDRIAGQAPTKRQLEIAGRSAEQPTGGFAAVLQSTSGPLAPESRPGVLPNEASPGLRPWNPQQGAPAGASRVRAESTHQNFKASLLNLGGRAWEDEE